MDRSLALATLMVLDASLFSGLGSCSLPYAEALLVMEPVLLTNVVISKILDSPTVNDAIVHLPSI